jgi:UDP-GlcNAc3NAcA epimerase
VRFRVQSKTILTVVGARPQFVKAAVVSRALREFQSLREVLIHTGQHYDANMSEIFFAEMEMSAPVHNLSVGSGSHAVQTARMLEALEPIVLKYNPRCVLIYGDTNSTLAASLVSAKIGVPVAHVESGLRSFNRAMPEEINRTIADHLSDLLFAPTRLAVKNLLSEGIKRRKIIETGDVMLDAALFYGEQARRKSEIMKKLRLEARGYVLATIHRAENVDDPARLDLICSALLEVSKKMPVVFPVHPRTRNKLKRLVGRKGSRVLSIDPVGYLDMVALETGAAVIATDSGGVQKEAYFHRVPCVTLRTETEWVELLKTGWSVLAPPMKRTRLAEIILSRVGTVGREQALYGDGFASRKIAVSLVKAFG